MSEIVQELQGRAKLLRSDVAVFGKYTAVFLDRAADRIAALEAENAGLLARIALLEGAAPVWPGHGCVGAPKYMREAAEKITDGMA